MSRVTEAASIEAVRRVIRFISSLLRHAGMAPASSQ
jgi:hypothetical protein